MRVRAAGLFVVLILVAGLAPAPALAAPSGANPGQVTAVDRLAARAMTVLADAGGQLGMTLARAGQSLPDRLRDWLGIGGSEQRPAVAPASPAPAAQDLKRRPLSFKRVKELTGKRTARAKVFELADGRVEAELSATPVHYRDAKGAWQQIDTSVARSDRRGFAFEATKSGFGTWFGDRSDRLVRFEVGGRWVTVGLPGRARPLAPHAEGSKVTFPGALGGGADLEYQVHPDGVRKQIVLHRPLPAGAAPSWSFTLQLGGLRAQARRDGSIALLDPNRGPVPLLVLPKPFMVDAADDPGSPYGKRWSDRVSQTISGNDGARDGSVTVTVRADGGWLADPARRFPVRVDPTIKIQPTTGDQAQDVRISQVTPNTNQDPSFALTVGTNASGQRSRALIKFPLTDLTGIPQGTQIDSATLQTYFDGSMTPPGPTQSVAIEARRATASWTATTATWNSMNTAFAEAGLAGATRSPNQANVWHSFNVRNIVQSWISGTQQNHGFMLKATDADEAATPPKGGPHYLAAPGLASYTYDYGGETQFGPKLVISYGRPAVTLNPPSRIHATGAELSWTPYPEQGPSPTPDDNLVEYQVYRRPAGSGSTTPSCGALAHSWCFYPARVAVVPPGTTTFTDTTAPPTPAESANPTGAAYEYWVMVKTADGQAVASGTQLVHLPKAGRTTLIVRGASGGDTTLTSAQPSFGHEDVYGKAWLSVGNQSTTLGITRALMKFSTGAIPVGATVLDADVGLWRFQTVGNEESCCALYRLHRVTRAWAPISASWNNATPSLPWTTPGGDFDPTSLSVAGGFPNLVGPGWRSWDATSAVQGWVSNPTTNHGLLLKQISEGLGSEETLFLATDAPEFPTPDLLLQPRLVVTYTEKTPENTYHAPTTPDRMAPGETATVPVTVTNTTAATLHAADQRLTTRWFWPDGSPVSTSQPMTALPRDLPPGDAVTVDATLTAPTPAAGSPEAANQRNAYAPTWELFNQTSGQFLSQAAGGVGGLPQKVSVGRPTSDELGLEKFYSYTGTSTGAGSTALVNQHAGNLVWSYDPIANPSRGPATFVRFTYNSLDTSNSAAGFGWSLSAASVMRQGSPLQFHPPGQEWPTTVRLTDGDGTTHVFTLNKHNSTDPADWDYDHPAGVHLYLQKLAPGDDARVWRMTRPDRTEFLFDADGYQSVTRDRNGNELRFVYDRRKSNNKPIKFLKALIDEPALRPAGVVGAGRQTLTITTYAKGQTYDYYDSNTNAKVVGATSLTNPHIIDQVQTITDISGRRLKLVYSDKGLLKELVDGDGNPSLAKTFLFDYDATQGNKNVKLVKITDPVAVASTASPKPATTLAYMSPPADLSRFHFWAKTITDRRNNATRFAYVDPDGPQGDVIETTVTDAELHATFTRTDAFGRPNLVRDAKQQPTTLQYDADHNVTKLTEANTAEWSWTYDPNTGFPTEIKDAQAVFANTPGTTLTYQTSRNGFIADLAEKRSPQGRRWAFGYDTKGNLTSVTDPKGVATPTVPNDFQTVYEYDVLGQMSKATDANEHATLFSAFEANGYPQTITDARNKQTLFTYDVRGNVLTVRDPNQKVTSQTYDLFGRPRETRVPKDQNANPPQIIVTPEPLYDRNDNVLRSTAPNGAITTAVYDPTDQVTSMVLPIDQAGDPARTVTYTYDKVGNLRTQTEPKGNLTTTVGDFVTTYNYDEIYQQTSAVNAEGDTLSYVYDDVGNVTTVIDPNKNATTNPADFTAKYTYDRSHRVLEVTDALDHKTKTRYDLDGQVIETTDQENNTTLVDLDERAMPREVKVPHDIPNGTITHRITRYEYDEVGNRTRVISPRGVETTNDPDDFATTSVYDELNRVIEQRLPYDRDDQTLTTPDIVTYAYDDVGNLTTVSAPPSAGQTVRNITRYTHFDNGWVRTSTDPHDIATAYDYDPLGLQALRTIAPAGESPATPAAQSARRTMVWAYTPDGKLASRSDQGVPVGRQVMLVDNSDVQNVTTVPPTGSWPAATSGQGFRGFNYQTQTAGTGTRTFTWKLEIPQTGTYEVLVNYPAGATATNAPYRVGHAGGTTAKPVNQTTAAGTWVSLGSFAFTEGEGGTSRQVVLSDAANGTVFADAVRLVRNNSGEADAEGKTLTYRYDPNGNLTTATDTSSGVRVGKYTVDYDGLNQVGTVKEFTTATSTTPRNTTTFTYDPNGNPDTRTHDKEFADYGYDPRDLVDIATIGTSATDPDPKVTRFTYTPRGQKLRETKDNGNTVDHTYFLDGLLKTQVEKKASGSLVSSHTLTYNPNGHRITDVAKVQNADNNAAFLDHTYAYTYDPRDRLRQLTKSATGGGLLETESYAHDANSNVTTQTVDGATTNFVYDRNRLLRATTGSATANHNYDPFGRLDKVTSGTTVLERYVYDGFDRVLEHRKQSGTGTETTRYTYDPLDRTASRTDKAGTASQKTTDFNYLGLSGEVLSEEIAGQIQTSYQYSPWGQRLSQVKFKAGGVEEDAFYGYNPHADVETLTNETGDTRATYGYTAYGKDDTQSFTGIDKPNPQNPGAEPYNVYRFNAKRFDPATGDYDMGFRDYDPGLNRFLARDNYNGALADLNLGLSPWTMNRYAFAGGNPVSFIELDGHRLAMEEDTPCESLGTCTGEYGSSMVDDQLPDAVKKGMAAMEGEYRREYFIGSAPLTEMNTLELARVYCERNQDVCGRELRTRVIGAHLSMLAEAGAFADSVFSAAGTAAGMGARLAGRSAKLAEGGPFVDNLLYGARPGQGLPGATGVPISGRPTVQELQNLTSKHGVEFAVTYKYGPGPNGGGGQYFLHSGTDRNVRIPLEADRMFIYHTHPRGTASGSRADREVLGRLGLIGSPQRTSYVLPGGGQVIPFKGAF
jgi:RHS repeat-associated protein